MKSNRQLENTLRKAAVRMSQDIKEQEEKRNQKYWSEMKVPFRLNEGLSTYTKTELDAIRKFTKVKKASSLKKAELIERFQEEIPELLKSICHKWDADRFYLLVNIARNGGHIEAPEIEIGQITYLRETGLVFTGSLDGKKVLAVPEELLEEIITLEKDVQFKSVIARNTDWIKLTHGLLHYYGTLSVAEMISLLEKYTNESVDLFEYNYVVHDSMSFNKGIVIDNEGYSDARVVDVKKVRYEQQTRKNVFFYPFTKEQLLEAGERGFVNRNRSYVQAVNFIKQNFKTEDADRIVEECVYLTRNGHSLNDVLRYLSQVLVFENEATLRALMDKVVHLMNNTREWALKGHTSVELRNLYETQASSTETNETPTTKVSIKIGRNEPCPCLSGKKYKKCCGR